jgi:hypothetical protein
LSGQRVGVANLWTQASDYVGDIGSAAAYDRRVESQGTRASNGPKTYAPALTRRLEIGFDDLTGI